MEVQRPQRIVIIGAGFGGLYTYMELHRLLHGSGDAEIILINDSDQFVFTPMIHEVATGNLLPSSVTKAIRTVPQCCLKEFIHGRATAIDLDKQMVHVEYHQKDASIGDEDMYHHHHHAHVEYDYLVLAIGSESIFFGVPGAKEHSLPLKTLADARYMKNHIIERFEEAMHLNDPDKQRAELQFVIVGGGPTGVELAGEMNDLFAGELAKTFPELDGMARILIVEGGDRLLGAVEPWFSTKVQEKLDASERVYMLFNKRVTGVTSDGVHIGDEFIASKTVIWSGGVRARELAIAAKQPLSHEERSGRIQVTPMLHTEQYKNVFVIGDLAFVTNDSGKAYPMLAQFATHEGKHAARNIVQRIRGMQLFPFERKQQGFIVSLGKGGAFAEVFGFNISGPIAWFLYRTVYLSKAVGLRSKLRMALEWTLNLFLPRDASKL